MGFINCIQEKYKLSTRLNSSFNSFHDLKFPDPSSKLSRKLTVLSAKDCWWTGLLSINKCFLYHKKFDWMQNGTSELDTN